MKAISSIILSLNLLLQPLAALAEDCKVPVALTNPCRGVLLPSSAAADALKCLEIDLPRLQLELNKEKKVCEIKLEAMVLRVNTIAAHSDRLEILLDDALRTGEVPKAFWEGNTFWAVTGFFAGALITTGITFTVLSAVDF